MIKKSFIKGERLRARVVEIQQDSDLLCDVGGSLIRIQNNSRHQFKMNDILVLIVTSSQPAEFKLAEDLRHFERTI